MWLVGFGWTGIWHQLSHGTIKSQTSPHCCLIKREHFPCIPLRRRRLCQCAAREGEEDRMGSSSAEFCSWGSEGRPGITAALDCLSVTMIAFLQAPCGHPLLLPLPCSLLVSLPRKNLLLEAQRPGSWLQSGFGDGTKSFWCECSPMPPEYFGISLRGI